MDEQSPLDAKPVDVALIGIKQIMAMLPHRYPLLLIDRLVDVRHGESAIGIKNVTMNEQFFQGHFPGHPVMPGVLIVEAMAQTAAALVINTIGVTKGIPLVYFMSIDSAKFRKPVVPGDQLRIHVTKDRKRGNVWRFNGVAKVDGVTVAEALYTAMIMDDVAPAENQ
jgi:3-hydroxyacyl-[acyl-carrier-protein] dehydratase